MSLYRVCGHGGRTTPSSRPLRFPRLNVLVNHQKTPVRPGGMTDMIHEVYINRGAGYEWLTEIDADNVDDAEERFMAIHATLPSKARRARYAIRPRGQRSCVLPENWPAQRLRDQRTSTPGP